MCFHKGGMMWEELTFMCQMLGYGIQMTGSIQSSVSRGQGFFLSLFIDGETEAWRSWAMNKRSQSRCWQPQSWSSGSGLSRSLLEDIKLAKGLCSLVSLYLHLTHRADKAVARYWLDHAGWVWGFWQFLNIELPGDLLIRLFISEAGQGFRLPVKHSTYVTPSQFNNLVFIFPSSSRVLLHLCFRCSSDTWGTSKGET